MFKTLFLKLIDLFLVTFVTMSGFILKRYRSFGSARLPLSTAALKSIGVFPIRDHYYEPKFNHTKDSYNDAIPRDLPGIDMRTCGQLKLLSKLNYQDDFENFLRRQTQVGQELGFDITKGAFLSGDAEFLFAYVRHLKPKKIVEVGCGNTTKIIQGALEYNRTEGFQCEHLCIEPYEKPWLEKFPAITLVRSKIEDLSFDWSMQLQDGDLFFIDSSHVIRPGGDVLTEYLHIVPKLVEGVHVHVHDIFTPYDYLSEWLTERVYFWNEQYLLEALISDTNRYKIEAALNYLSHDHYQALKAICPYLTPSRRPGSFYFSIAKQKS